MKFLEVDRPSWRATAGGNQACLFLLCFVVYRLYTQFSH